MASVVDEVQAFPATYIVADDAEDHDDRNLEGAVGLDKVERVGAKGRLRDFQNSCRAKRRKVPGTFDETFELLTKLVGRENSPNSSPFDRLTSVKDAFATTQVAAKEGGHKTVSSLKQIHDTFSDSLLSGFNKAHVA